MALDNKQELYDAVRTQLDRTDITDVELDIAYRLTLENFSREIRPILLEAYANLPVVNGRVDIPADLLEIKLVVREDNVPMYARQDSTTVLEEFNNNAVRQGNAFARISGFLIFNGDIGNTVNIEYHQSPPSLLANDQDEITRAERLLQYSPNYFLYGMSYHTAVRLTHEQTEMFKELYIQTAGAIQEHTNRADETGGTLVQEGAENLNFNYGTLGN